MRTKDEILGLCDETVNHGKCSVWTKRSCFEAMDTHAEEVAIEFAQWFKDNYEYWDDVSTEVYQGSLYCLKTNPEKKSTMPYIFQIFKQEKGL